MQWGSGKSTGMTIRAARPDDRERIVKAFQGLDPASIRQRFFVVFSTGSGSPGLSSMERVSAETASTFRAYSRTRYEPGVQTGIFNSAVAGARSYFKRISTSSKCVHGFDIETV